jgi:hypothetical protein
MNVKEIVHRSAPELLYHYRTQNGLLGTVERREIWASHTQVCEVSETRLYF